MVEGRMPKRKAIKAYFIDDVQVPNDFLTNRAGLIPFLQAPAPVNLVT